MLTATKNLRELRVGGGEASVKLGRSVFVLSSVDYDTPSFLRSSPLHAACTEEGPDAMMLRLCFKKADPEHG